MDGGGDLLYFCPGITRLTRTSPQEHYIRNRDYKREKKAVKAESGSYRQGPSVGRERLLILVGRI